MSENEEMKSPVNLPELRDLLLGQKCRDATNIAIRARLFDDLIRSMGTRSGIGDAIINAFAQVCGGNLFADPNLVADIIKAVEIAYPLSGLLILKTLEESADSYLTGAGEGIAIGLFEVSEKDVPSFDHELVESLQRDVLLGSMFNSSKTSAGSGRLTNAINLFVSSTWVKQGPISRIRRIQITRLLKKWNEVLSSRLPQSINKDRPVDGFWNFSNHREETFLETIADELSKRFFISSPLGLRFYLVRLLEDNLPKELTRAITR